MMLVYNASMFYITKFLPQIIISIGIILRIVVYLDNRSLYIDEADLINNIIRRSFLELTKPLDNEQHAPIGFLFVEKLAFLTFGDSEYIFRLYPLIMGITSVILFYNVARHLLKYRDTIIALVLFSLSEGLIYYTSEAKQYMGDVNITLLLLYVFVISKRFNQVSTAVVGTVVPWVSHASIFILFSICITKWKQFSKVIPLWIGSIILEYVIILRHSISRPADGNFWLTSYAPLPPLTNKDVVWVEYVIKRYLSFIWPSPSIIVLYTQLVLISIGLAYYFKQNRTLTINLMLPFALVYVASGLHTYPMVERLLLFLAPIIFIFASHGTGVLIDRLRQDNRFVYYSVTLILLAVAFYGPVKTAKATILNPPVIEDLKPLLSFYSANRQARDILYVSSGAQSVFQYYRSKYAIDDHAFVSGSYIRGGADRVIQELKQHKGKPRVWILFSHITSPSRADVETVISHLPNIATMLMEKRSTGAALFLYDFR